MGASSAGAEEGWTSLQERKKEAVMVEALQKKAPDTISGSNPARAARMLKSLLHPFQGFKVFFFQGGNAHAGWLREAFPAGFNTPWGNWPSEHV